MRSDVKNRSDREAELYDKQRLRRDGFESALTYLNDGVGRLRRNEAIRAAMRMPRDCGFLRSALNRGNGASPVMATSRQNLPASTSRRRNSRSVEHRRRNWVLLTIPQRGGPRPRIRPTALTTWCSGSAFCIISSLPARCAKSPGSFETAERSFHRTAAPQSARPLGALVDTAHPHTPGELPFGRPELRVIDQTFEVDSLGKR